MEQQNRPVHAGSSERPQKTALEKLESFKLSGDRVVIIDQFMLGAEQFLCRLQPEENSGPEPEAVRESVEMFGGCVLDLGAGSYSVFREPTQSVMLLYDYDAKAGQRESEDNSELEQQFDDDVEHALSEKAGSSSSANILIDTRCLVFIDEQLLAKKELLQEYQDLRKRGFDKKGRDLLREQGAAVRYGFDRLGDELGLYALEGDYWKDRARYALIPE